MRRLLAALLAVPVILASYVPRRVANPQALLVLSLPAILLGLSLLRMELTARPVAAGVAAASATAFPDAAFEPVAVGVSPRAARSPGAGYLATPGDDHPDRGLAQTRGARVALAAAAPPRPIVVRFRPAAKSSGVAPAAEVSVRFTQPMDQAVTARTLAVTVGGKAVAGSIRWAEDATVLVFRPTKPFPAGATVAASVSSRAKSAAGARIVRSAAATFTVAKPAPKATRTASGGKTRRIPRAVAAGLYGVELYALELMNCTRTGGVVRSNGTCRGAGSRNVAPLKLDAGISDTVARPYAYLLASRRLCHHFYDGNPGDRLRRAGYTNWDWAENVGGCGSNAPYASVLSTHLYFQSEGYYSRHGHYRNIMNAKYDRVGIGVVKVNGLFRMVVDFYHP